MIRGCLMVHYLGKSDFVEAEKMGQDLLAICQQLQPSKVALHYQTLALYSVAECQYVHGEEDLAIANLQEAIQLCTAVWDPQQGLARAYLIRLEEWFLEQGRLKSAAEVQDRRVKIRESIDLRSS